MRENKYRVTSLSLAISLSMIVILTHTVAAFSVSLLLFSFWFGFEVYKKIYRDRFTNPVSLVFSIIFMVSMLSWWIYASGHFSLLVSYLERGLTVPAWLPSSTASLCINELPLEFMLNILAFNLFTGFSVIGTFYILHKKIINKYGFVIVLSGVLLTALMFFSLLFNLSAFLQYRWYPIYQFIMAIPASIGIFLICGTFRSNFKKILILAVIVSFFSFFSITNIYTNIDNPIYSKNTMIRYNYMDSEIQAIDTISNIYDGTCYSDGYYCNNFVFQNTNLSLTGLADNFILGDYKDIEGLIVIRDEIVKRPFNAHGTFRLSYNPHDKLANLDFNRIYDSESVTAYAPNICF